MPFFACYELMCVVGEFFIGMDYGSQNEGLDEGSLSLFQLVYL